VTRRGGAVKPADVRRRKGGATARNIGASVPGRPQKVQAAFSWPEMGSSGWKVSPV
jgi:hypothetical protein